MHRIFNLAVALALCVALGGCDGASKTKEPNYTPIPDRKLFAQVAEISGVSKVDIEYLDEFGNSNGYVGDIYLDSNADSAMVLDRALAILRQGKWRASMTVVAVQDGRQISTDVLGLQSTTNEDLTKRYGPQPGDGKPPETTPTP